MRDREGEARTLSDIGSLHRDIAFAGHDEKELYEALNYFKHGLTIQEELEDKLGMVLTLTNMGDLLLGVEGMEKQALDFFELVLPVERELGDRET